jgi:hypothetical protein
MVNDAKGQPATLTLVREKDPFDVQVTPEQHKPGLGWRAGPVEGAPAPSFKLPPGMQFVGPGVVVPPPVAAEIQSLKEQVEALRKEHQALLEQVKQLSEQLHQQQK